MLSQSSRRRSDSSGYRDHVVRLLHDGALLGSPAPDLLAVADRLRALGVIETEDRAYVKCANHEDGDFPPRNRDCAGRVYLEERLHDSGGELGCPDCERPVFPDQYGKRRFSELRVRVLYAGVMTFLKGLLAALDSDIGEGVEGVLQLKMGGDGVIVCVVDFCHDEKFLSRDRAAHCPTCYVAVNARDYEARFVPDDRVHRVLLADVICGITDLTDVVQSVVRQGEPTGLRHASVPVCDNRPVPVVIKSAQPMSAGRRFVVEVGQGIVRIEGIRVIAKQAGPRLIVFQALWQQFLADLQRGLSPSAFAALPIRTLMTELEKQTGKKYPDETTVRRTINLLQTDIEKTLKRALGIPVDREDVVQTCDRTGQRDSSFGYRINPFTVAARPFQPDLSQES